MREIRRAFYIGHFADGNFLFEPLCYLPLGILTHAVDEHIRTRIEQYRAAHLVLPIVVVGKAAQARLQAADDDRHIGEGLPRPVRVHDGRSVRAQARLFAGRIEILAAALFGRRVVCNHGVQVAGAYQNGKLRSAEGGKVGGGVPVRLRKHRNTVALGLKHTADDRGAEARVVDIRIAGDEQKVVPPPATLDHFVPRDG